MTDNIMSNFEVTKRIYNYFKGLILSIKHWYKV